MNREENTGGIIKCRNITHVVTFPKTTQVISAALWGFYYALDSPIRRMAGFTRRSLPAGLNNALRRYSPAQRIAVAMVLVWHLTPGTAHAAAPPAGTSQAAEWVGESGTASYYGPAHHGRRTASGTRFDQKALTAAHPWLPFGTRVRVTLEGTRRSVIVVITDRLYSHTRVVDLSMAAARQLGIIRQGVATVLLSPA